VAVPPIVADLVIEQGTTWSVRWVVSDPDTGVPLNVSGWTVRSQVRDPIESDVVLHEWSTAGGTITADASGNVTLLVAPATSSAWAWVRGRYDVELISPQSEVTRLAQGRVRVSHEVTR
jgi:hypothetical protein